MNNDRPERAALTALLREQRDAYLRTPYPSWDARASHLRALRRVMLDNRDALADAIGADFGNRAKQEVLLAEFLLIKEAIDAALKHGRRWMKPRRRRTNKWLLPARAKVVPQPLGVVGILVAWNYPLLLAVGPLVCALAAGNRAIVKMPELTPRTSALFERLIGETFARDHVAVVNGDASLGAAFSAQPFDHLLFTGSTRVGRDVMRAAAEHLTPVTLELGGKSPAIIGPHIGPHIGPLMGPLMGSSTRSHARFDHAVDSIIAGKLLNAGQTCVAPDYVLVPRGAEQAFIERARRRVAQLYPDFANNRDYTSIISAAHVERLERLAADAHAAGARLHPLTDAASGVTSGVMSGVTFNTATRRFAPLVVTDAPDDCALMQQEIFGPLLPLVPYDTLDDALRWINARPRPLALYLFADDAATIERVTFGTIAGGMAVNETLLHLACDDLPFGGVGASGMGAYHGYTGFATFSKMKPVLTQSRLNARGWVAPPYGKRVEALLKLMMRF